MSTDLAPVDTLVSMAEYVREVRPINPANRCWHTAIEWECQEVARIIGVTDREVVLSATQHRKSILK